MKKLYFGFLAILLLAVSLFSACTGSSTQTSSQATTTKPSPTTSALTSTQSASGNWWEKFGTPQYGGEITIPSTTLTINFDPDTFQDDMLCFAYEGFFYSDWTVDRNEWAAPGGFIPPEYVVANLAESWDITDQQTITIHLRQDVKWQDKSPVNGREFTAEDVVFHFDRFLGTGNGYTEPSVYAAMMASNWDHVTATDKYTVVIHFKNPCGGVGFYSVSDVMALFWFEPQEWAALVDKERQDWHNVAGTGPWILADYVPNTSATWNKNPAYWGTDPRYPQNQVPYADTLKVLCIPDTATSVAALRTGKIDRMTNVGWSHAESLGNTDMEKAPVALNTANGLMYRLDKEPFTDIRVRKALDMAINRQEIANSLYHGMSDGEPCGNVAQVYKGYAYEYADWPQSLKDEYSYNPTKAKELLAEAGFPNGFKTNAVTGTDSAFTELVVVFKAYFQDIGVDMEIIQMEGTAFQSYVRSFKQDAMAQSDANHSWTPTRTIEQFYSNGPDSGTNGLSLKPDSTYDELRNDFWASTTMEEAARICIKADKYVIEQHFGVFVTGFDGFNVWQPYLKGYSNEYLQWSQQITWARLWVDSSMKQSMGR